MEEMFGTMLREMGFEAWWEADGVFEIMENRMIEAGYNIEEVRAFFAEMEEEL